MDEDARRVMLGLLVRHEGYLIPGALNTAHDAPGLGESPKQSI